MYGGRRARYLVVSVCCLSVFIDRVGSSSCALLGGFAIGERVSLLRQHSAAREMSASACIRSMPGSPWLASVISPLGVSVFLGWELVKVRDLSGVGAVRPQSVIATDGQ